MARNHKSAFVDRVSWEENHRECKYVRVPPRASQSRIFMCWWMCRPHRCTFRLCPRVRRMSRRPCSND